MCAAGGVPAARSSAVGLRLTWGGAAIGRGAETEDTAVVRIRQYKQCKRQYSTVVCVSAYRRWRCVVQSFLPLADYAEVFRTACRRTATGSTSGGLTRRGGGRLLGEWRSSSGPLDARPADRRGTVRA